MSTATDGGTAGVGTPAVAPALALDGVSAGYGRFQALFGVSVAVAPGRALAILGHNGMGKTTIARVGSGLVAPTAGTVHVDGRDLTGLPTQAFAAAGVAHAPEGRSVFATLTVRENLTLTFRKRFGRAGVPGALDRVFTLFPRLGERQDQLAGSLSGGEQRMLTLARVLVTEPRVVIADELSLGLAPIITDEVYGVLAQIKGSGSALVVIEQHVHHALELADEVVVLDRGRVVHRGPPTERDRLLAMLGASADTGLQDA